MAGGPHATRARDMADRTPATANEVTLHAEHSKLLEAAGMSYHELDAKGFRAGDTLVVVDMQNDFLPEDDAPEGGRFGVAEGAEAAKVIIPLIARCAQAGGKVVSTHKNARWAADLVDMTATPSKGGQKYILVVQDLYSRQIHAVDLTTRVPGATATARRSAAPRASPS